MNKYIDDLIHEMKHNVSWPAYSELQKSTVMVLAGSLVFSMVVGLMDFVYDGALSLFYNQF